MIKFLLPEYLSFVPRKRKPWIVNLIFARTAGRFNEKGFYATLLDLHKRKILTIEKEGKELIIKLNEK